VRNAVPREQRNKLFLERDPPMVFFLPTDVFHNRIGIGRADAERAVAFLKTVWTRRQE